jgi:hypothetical protein
MGKKKIGVEEWVSGNEAAAILTENSKHTVSTNYVRLLAAKGAIRSRAKDGRTKEYHKGDLMAYTVEPKTKKDRERLQQAEDDSAA